MSDQFEFELINSFGAKLRNSSAIACASHLDHFNSQRGAHSFHHKLLR